MSINVQEAIAKVSEEFKKQYGEDAKLENGDIFIIVFDNCTLITSKNDEKVSFEFLGDKPFYVEGNVDMYEREE